MREFTHRDVTIPKTLKSSSQLTNVSNIFIQLIQTLFSSYFYCADEQLIFVGLSSGRIFYYKKRNMDSKLLVYPGKEHD